MYRVCAPLAVSCSSSCLHIHSCPSHLLATPKVHPDTRERSNHGTAPTSTTEVPGKLPAPERQHSTQPPPAPMPHQQYCTYTTMETMRSPTSSPCLNGLRAKMQHKFMESRLHSSFKVSAAGVTLCNAWATPPTDFIWQGLQCHRLSQGTCAKSKPGDS